MSPLLLDIRLSIKQEKLKSYLLEYTSGNLSLLHFIHDKLECNIIHNGSKFEQNHNLTHKDEPGVHSIHSSSLIQQ